MPAPRKSASRPPAAVDAPPRDALRKAILDGVFLPGERLVEATLCERFHASIVVTERRAGNAWPKTDGHERKRA